MRKLKLTEALVLRALTRSPQTVAQIIAKLGLRGASSAARARAILRRLLKGPDVVYSQRYGWRGRPALLYAKR